MLPCFTARLQASPRAAMDGGERGVWALNAPVPVIIPSPLPGLFLSKRSAPTSYLPPSSIKEVCSASSPALSSQ